MATTFEQEASFLVIGERTNANGSNASRDAMLAGDFETTVAMARDQVNKVPICSTSAASTTRGPTGYADMTEVARRLAVQSTIPLVIDTTEAPVAEAALQWIGGRPVLNSVNLEDGDAPPVPGSIASSPSRATTGQR